MIRRSARLLRRLAAFVLACAVLTAALAGAAAWRLAQGPVPLDALARFIERHVAGDGSAHRLAIGEAALVWEGFGAGVDRPIDVRVRDVRALAPDGGIIAEIPEGAVSLGLRALLLGRFQPRAVEIVGVRLRLVRDEAGGLTVDLGTLADAFAGRGGDEDAGLAERLFADLGFGVSPAPAGRRFDLARVRIRHADLLVEDRRLGATWSVSDATLDLIRRPDRGGVAVTLDGTALAGEARLRLTLRGDLAQDLSGRLDVATGGVVPATLAAALPGLGALEALDAPLSVEGAVQLGPALDVAAVRIEARAGAGGIVLPGGGRVPLSSARALLGLAGNTLTIEDARIVLPGRAGPSPTLTLAGLAQRDGPAWVVTGEAVVDRVAFADLASLWPEGIGVNERAWITTNITEGEAVGARVEGALRIDPDSGRVSALAVSGTGRVENATVHYLRPMPPVTGVAAEARLALDRLVVEARHGSLGAIRTRSATIVLSGLDTTPQWADVALAIESPVPDAMALLAHPKLDLFARRGAPPPGLSGNAEIDLAIRFPLLDALTVDQVEARASAHIVDAGVRDAVLGAPIERGRFALRADREALRVEGTGALAGLEAALTYDVDFRGGPPSQVIERATLRLAPQAGVAEAFGLPLAPYVTGRLGGEARLAMRRDRQASVTLSLDLAAARLAVPEIGWEKPPGEPASAQATVRLTGPRVTAVDAVRLDGPGLSARGRAEFTADGRPRRLEVATLALGRTRLSGEVLFPARDGEAWSIAARGPLLDLSRRPTGGPERDDHPRPALAIEARIDRVLVGDGDGRDLRDVAVTLRHDGRVLQALDARGVAGAAGAWSATVRRAASGRTLDLRAGDAGAFLRATGVFSTMAGGQLAVTGRWDEARRGGPLVGEATIDEFSLRDAPTVGRVLQAMTLYGLLEMARGPGLSFSRLIAPFSYDGTTLELRDARAYGASLGFTAKGTADLAARRLAMEGTIVPAYVFNALLGQIPLIGRIFSPERGGGLFAATYRMSGPLDAPDVSVNPLAALTPGFLRGLFGLFDGGGAAAEPGRGIGNGQPADPLGIGPQGGG